MECTTSSILGAFTPSAFSRPLNHEKTLTSFTDVTATRCNFAKPNCLFRTSTSSSESVPTSCAASTNLGRR
jgi:hypothetical protein